MKNLGHRRIHPFARAWALVLASALLGGALPVAPANAQVKRAAQRLSDEQRVAHALNRLAFGPRPGEIERVRQLGLERWLEQQLHPEQLDDAAAEAKLRNLPTLSLPTHELYARFPQPGQLLRELQRQGKLPADLRALAAARLQGQPAAPAQQQNGATSNDVMSNDAAGDAMKADAAKAADDTDKKEYRQAILAYMRERGLQPPQRLTAELQAARILRAVYSERQLQEVMVDFWTNHFNVFAGKGADRWLLTAYDRDTIRPRVFGKFADLLVATAQSPAMLFYLDNFQSVSPDARGGAGRQQALRQLMQDDPLMRDNQRARQRRAQRLGLGTPERDPLLRGQGQAQTQMPSAQAQRPPQQRPKRGINENYARELMELHTLGVDGGYTQKDVQEVARCFTGWTIIAPRGAGGLLENTALAERAGTFYFNPRTHDDGEKTVLGHKIPAGGGMNDGLSVLDILAHHPSTAKFIATKLARKFVTDEPSPQLVARVAAAYTKSDGDIRETLRAVFTSPEFNAPENLRAKIKTPFELAVSAVRALGGETNGGPALHQWLARMGEPLYQYQPPTGYPDTAEHWVNTGALLERINFALALAGNRIPGTSVELARFAGAQGSKVEQARVLDAFVDALLQGDMSAQTRASLLKKLNEASAPPADAAPARPQTGPAAAQAADDAALMDADGRAAMNAPDRDVMDADARAARRERRQQARFGQLAANNAPAGNAEVARIAALILGSPEFQRQ
ncbi:MAG TPA: DUF1800 domain-containing protein [Pyrinomonadaceae bacterium]|jgi:uncharacterized protein (DUF1800 family)